MKIKLKKFIYLLSIIELLIMFLSPFALATNLEEDTTFLANVEISSEAENELPKKISFNYIDSKNLSSSQGDKELLERNAKIQDINKSIKVISILVIVSSLIYVFKIFKILFDEEKLDKEKDKEEISKKDNDIIKLRKKAIRNALIGGVGFIVTSLFDIITAVDKPIIYIYPKEKTKVKVKLGKPEKLTCSYPKYNNAWEVLAEPTGELVDLKTNKKLYSLYWEGKDKGVRKELKDGFIVKGEEVANFLDEKLEILGLNYKEREEFIIYWLPKLEKNEYNFIRFKTLEEIEEYMPLVVEPKPDTMIRVMMEFKELKKFENINEQVLNKVERKGYTVVEWGGTKLI